MSFPLRVVIVVSAVLSGCGPSPTEFCSSLSQKMGELQHGCAGGGPTDLIKAAVAKGCTTQLEGQTRNNRGVYLADKAASCLKLLDTATCVDLSTPSSTVVQACSAVVKGTVAMGGACIFEQDCANGAACVQADPASCGGTCTAKKFPGGQCKVASDCDPGGPTKRAVCTNLTGTCAQEPAPTHTEVALGGSCGNASDTEIQVCARDTTCNTNGNPNNPVCVAILREGEACTVGEQRCEFYTSCKGGLCTRWNGPGGSCSAMSTTTEEATYCLDANCVSGTCVALKKVAEGCTSSNDCESLSCVDGKCAAACDETRP